MAKKFRLSDANVRHVAFCKKGAIPDAVYALVKSADLSEGEVAFAKLVPFAKVDSAKKQVFGYFWVPDKVDLQKDFIESDEIEKSVHTFMKNLTHGTADGTGASDAHVSIGGGYPIEIAVDRDGSLGKAAGIEGIPGAAWLGMQVTDDKIWKKIESGEYTAFSPGGSVRREAVEADEPVAKSDDGEEETPHSMLAKFRKSLQAGIDKIVDLAKGDGDAVTYQDAKSLRDAKDQIWRKHWQLEDSITSILGDDTVEDKVAMVSDSIDQYKTDMLGLVGILQAIKSKKQTTYKSDTTQEGEDAMTKEELETLTKSLGETVETSIENKFGEKLNKIDKIEERLTAVEGKLSKAEGEEDPIQVVKKELTGLADGLKKTADRLDKIERTPEPRKGDPEPAALTKTDEDKLTPEQRQEGLAKSAISRMTLGAGRA